MVIADPHDASHELHALAHKLARIERESFSTPHLASLAAALRSSGEPPSQAIARLGRMVTLLDSEENQFFQPIAWALLWSTQLAFAVEAWRARQGPAISLWLETLGELEALLALAGYSFEHPDDPFPTIVESGSRFDGHALGHPLLPDAQTTRNDVRLGDDEPRAMLVSGSNMSGKSTLLRTVGINAVLALAGAPVRARALTISPLAIGATLRIEDSLQAGRSRFFAEISRLRELVDRARGPLPLLFLLDEIFHGTNSQDRRVGAEAVIGTLIDQQAIGLVTTHDLALTELTARADGAVVNMHFEDQFSEGAMTFDYRLRPGVVQKSNALALMRAVGLEV
jgi:DNA mismatch repair ATPase MutS